MKYLTISDFCKTGSGGTPSRTNKAYYENGTIPWIKSGELARPFVDSAEEYITKEAIKKSSAKLLEPGAILLAMYGATVGEVSRLTISAATNQAICHLYPDATICDDNYLYRVLQSAKHALLNKRVGGGQPNISQGIIKDLHIPLPPLPEQKRIATILDAADALRAKRRQSIAELDALLQATFLEMFGDPVENPKGWERDTLQNAFNFTTGKLDSNAAVVGGKYPFFTCSRETYAIDDAAFDCEALLLAGNNANADYSVKYYKGKFNAYQRTYVITLRSNLITYEYAKMALEYLLADLKRFSKGSNTKYLTMSILNRMPILLPPLSLQEKFAAIVTYIENQKSMLMTHLTELDTLFASLQQRAFNGEL